MSAPRWEIRPYNTPNEHVWVILRDSKAVAEVYDRQDAEFVLSALQARTDTQPTPYTRCSAWHRDDEQSYQCTRDNTSQAHADGYHRHGPGVFWLIRPGTDNATGLRATIQTLQGLTEDGEPDLLARLQAFLTRARKP